MGEFRHTDKINYTIPVLRLETHRAELRMLFGEEISEYYVAAGLHQAGAAS